jgi:hypothetical protein
MISPPPLVGMAWNNFARKVFLFGRWPEV